MSPINEDIHLQKKISTNMNVPRKVTQSGFKFLSLASFAIKPKFFSLPSGSYQFLSALVFTVSVDLWQSSKKTGASRTKFGPEIRLFDEELDLFTEFSRKIKRNVLKGVRR